MPVPLFDLKRKNDEIQEAVENAAIRVLRSGKYILGEELEKFEKASAESVGAKHALGVSSGTDALLLALMALGVGPGDEVVTTPFTFASSCTTAVRLGARPVFCDIDPATFNISPGAVSKAVTKATKAVLPVHLFGLCADVKAVAAAAPGLPVIEDAAQAQGATAAGKAAGSMGAIGCFSFYPTKNLGAYGDSGMVTTSDEGLSARMKLIRVHGDSGGYVYERIGANFRMDPLQAAMMAVKLPLMQKWIETKRKAATLYRKLFEEAGLAGREIVLPTEPKGYTHTYALYVIRAKNRDMLKAHLAKNGIGCNVYYPVPMHLEPALKHLGYREGAFPEAEKACKEVLAVPMFAGITDAEVAEVVSCVKGFYGKRP